MKSKIWILICSCIVLALSSVAYYLYACSSPLVPVFYKKKHPDYPLSAYASGNLGIVEPTYFTPYLFIAYRHLAGQSFDSNELEILQTLWSPSVWNREYSSPLTGDLSTALELRRGKEVKGQYPMSFYTSQGEDRIEDPVAEWLHKRSNVIRTGPWPQIDQYRRQNYSSYLVYPDSSFKTAARTLNTMIANYGAENPYVLEWVQSQDQVYSVGQNSESIPSALPDEAPPFFRQHRAYQIAAALFYAERFDEAIQTFDAISRDTDSPWCDWGDYLVARCYIRKASLMPVTQYNGSLEFSEFHVLQTEERNRRKEIMRQAEKRLRSVLGGRRNPDVIRAAEQSLSLVLYRITPSERMFELSRRMSGSGEAVTEQELIDGLRLLANRRNSLYTSGSNFTDEARKQNELIDWIYSFQRTNKLASSHSYNKWRDNPDSIPWLVVALRHANGEISEIDPLLEKAKTIEADSPAYATVTYHRARILAHLARHTEAATLLDGLLEVEGEMALMPSSRNRVLTLRMEQAEDLDEFAKFLPRRFLGNAEYGTEFLRSGSYRSAKEYSLRELLDSETLSALPLLPLSSLRDLCLHPELSESLQEELAIRVWSRAVLLQQWQIALTVTPLVSRKLPDHRVDLDLFLKADEDGVRLHTAIFLMLRESRLAPEFVQTTYGYRKEDDLEQRKERFSSSFPFLTSAIRQTAEREYGSLHESRPWINHFCRVVLDWAEDDSEDSRVPEALHLAVAGTRHATLYSKSDEETGTLSRRCFQLLHKRYPESPWTAQTPYWYR